MQPGTYQKFGTKTLVFLLVTRLLPSLLLIVALIALLIIKVLSTPYINHLNTQEINIINQAFIILESLGLVLFFVILLGAGLWTWLEYSNYKFLVDDQAFKIKKGIFNVEENSILYRQIQNVDIERPLFYRLFGLSRIVILTAGHEDSDAPLQNESEGIIDAVDNSLAETLQSELLRRSNIEEVVTVPASARNAP